MGSPAVGGLQERSDLVALAPFFCHPLGLCLLPEGDSSQTGNDVGAVALELVSVHDENLKREKEWLPEVFPEERRRTYKEVPNKPFPLYLGLN